MQRGKREATYLRGGNPLDHMPGSLKLRQSGIKQDFSKYILMILFFSTFRTCWDKQSYLKKIILRHYVV